MGYLEHLQKVKTIIYKKNESLYNNKGAVPKWYGCYK